jgi:hypothetical protein
MAVFTWIRADALYFAKNANKETKGQQDLISQRG